MLTVTETAAEALDTIAESASAPEGAGLRIAQSDGVDGSTTLSLTLAVAPEPSDQVVETSNVPVFVDAAAADFLEDKVLDAEVQDGQVGFTLSESGS
jgi:iron-sulfur cluster assembly protein